MATSRHLSTRLQQQENPALRQKSAMMGTKMGTRSALGDIGNKAGVNINRAMGKEAVKQPLKPVRTNLTRQKATASLQLENNGVKTRKASTEMFKQQQKDLQIPKQMEVEEDEDVNMKDVEMEEVPAFSTLRTAEIEDIDADDRENPQLAVEYVNEIYAYMRELEKQQFIAPNYLETMSGRVSIKPKMRNLLVDWLVDVHQQFSLLQETLYLAVAILDRFLMAKAKTLTTKQLQLVGITAMFVASKYEEMYPPELSDFVFITDSAYTCGEVKTMEIEMMEALNFDLGRPLPLNFLRRNSKAGSVDSMTHGLAKYVMELALVDYRMAHVAPSVLAAASLAFAMRLLDTEQTSLIHLWTPTLHHYTAYSIEELGEAISAIGEVVALAHGLDSEDSNPHKGKKKLKAVTKKYSNKKFLKISCLPCLKDDLVLRMAREGEI